MAKPKPSRPDILILFGAGASYGSVDVSPYPPPLGKNLFHELENFGEISASLPEELKKLFRANFEQGIKEYFEYSGNALQTFQLELARYLSQFRANPNNVYVSLIESLLGKNVVYSTLNYDLLFEDSMSIVGKKLISKGYPENSYQFYMLKIHGSINFWPDLQGMKFDRVIFSHGGLDLNARDIEAKTMTLMPEEARRRCYEENCISPIMSIYTEGKPVRNCRGSILRQQRIWKTTVSKSKNIFICGASINSADEHIWLPLSKSTSQLYYFGLDGDRENFETWVKQYRINRRSTFIDANFESAVDVIKRLSK